MCLLDNVTQLHDVLPSSIIYEKLAENADLVVLQEQPIHPAESARPLVPAPRVDSLDLSAREQGTARREGGGEHPPRGRGDAAAARGAARAQCRQGRAGTASRIYA